MTPYAPTATPRVASANATSSSGWGLAGSKCTSSQESPPSCVRSIVSTCPTAQPCFASAKYTAVRFALAGTGDCVQVRPASAECRMWPRSPTATTRGPAQAASSISERTASGAITAGRDAGSSGTASWPSDGGAIASANAASASLIWNPFLTCAAVRDRGRCEVGGRLPGGEVDGHPLFVVEAECKVAARLQVIGRLERRPEGRDVVVVDRMAFLHPPQLVAVVIAVDDQDLPRVLVDVERAALVDVSLAGLQRRVDDPNPVQLIARVLLVDVQRLQDVAVLELVAVQRVRVVRDDDFLLADQLPVVALGAAVVYVELVGCAQPVRAGARVVEGDVRSAPHAALARVVQPGLAVLPGLVERLVHQQDLACEPRRRKRLLDEEDDDVVECLLGRARHRVADVGLVPQLDHVVAAGAGYRRLADHPLRLVQI